MDEPSTAALARVLTHAAHHSPFYRDQDWAASVRSGKKLALNDLPVTPKDAVRGNAERFYCSVVPASEGEVTDVYTSGSSGQPMRVRKTKQARRASSSEAGRLRVGWGISEQKQWVQAGNIQADRDPRSVSRSLINDLTIWTIHTYQADLIGKLLLGTRATYLTTFPSAVLGVLESFRGVGFLRVIATVGETVPPELPALIARLPHCRHYDRYAAEEVGTVAGLCAACKQYHPADRHLIVELLDETGRPARPGQLGKVVVTNLQNLAMPLIRYEVGDFAVASGKQCERGRPVFSQITGRERSIFKLPSGGTVNPMMSARETFELGVRRLKFVQTTLSEVEVRYIPGDPTSVLSTEQAQNIVDRYLSPEYRALPVAMESFPSLPNGKYIMHESLL